MVLSIFYIILAIGIIFLGIGTLMLLFQKLCYDIWYDSDSPETPFWNIYDKILKIVVIITSFFLIITIMYGLILLMLGVFFK